MNNEQLKAQLLFKLYRRGIWGKKHTPIKNLFHLVSQISVRDSKKAIKDLSNLNWIQLKKSTGEIHISLNPHKKNEIKSFILDVLNIDSELLR